jgi:hypothetical protein
LIIFKAQINATETYFNSKLLRKYFNLLRANVTDEHHEQYLDKRADDYYRLRYLRLYYTYWKVQARIHKQYQMNWRIVCLKFIEFLFNIVVFFL